MSSCNDCKFFVQEHTEDPVRRGQCRRMPPQLRGWGKADGWPTVWADDWCGEYKYGQPWQHYTEEQQTWLGVE